MTGSLGFKAARVAIVRGAVRAVGIAAARPASSIRACCRRPRDVLAMLWRSAAARACTKRSASRRREVLVAFVIAVPLGAADRHLHRGERLFRRDLQADAVLRLQRAEIDLPADVHPDLRHRLPAEGRLRGLLHHLRRHHERDGGGRVGQGRPCAGRALLWRDARGRPRSASMCRA